MSIFLIFIRFSLSISFYPVKWKKSLFFAFSDFLLKSIFRDEKLCRDKKKKYSITIFGQGKNHRVDISCRKFRLARREINVLQSIVLRSDARRALNDLKSMAWFYSEIYTKMKTKKKKKNSVNMSWINVENWMKCSWWNWCSDKHGKWFSAEEIYFQ